MYILKNSFRNIARNKGRSILTGIIIFVIALSCCIALSIRQSAETAKADTLSGLSITAQISMDRSSMMEQAKSESSSESSEVDKSEFAKMVNGSELSVSDMQKYAKAESVSDFYYTLTSSVNSSIEAVDSSSSTSDSTSETANAPSDNGKAGGKMEAMMGTQGDFTLTGYSSDSAMTAFVNGTSKISSGKVFTENTKEPECIISSELATYNSLSVGDTIKITNPNDDDEAYTLKVVGIYTNSQSGVSTSGNMGFSTSTDPANEIYMSYNALKVITDKSSSVATTTTNDMGLEQSSAMSVRTSGTYVFASVEDYEKFDSQARTLGLSDDYTVSSQDLTNYEQSLAPLETLSKTAGYFLIVILIIGAIILVVLNIFSVRERKYEIGVLTAIGMKKKKVALQFISEILVITLMAVIIGGAVGAVSSVPVTNKLLESQITASQESQSTQQTNFGRPSENGSQSSSSDSSASQPPETNSSNSGMDKMFGSGNSQVQYVSSVSSAVNISVLLELLGICVLLAMAGSAVAVTAIMRYEPLKILSNRD